MSYFTWMAGALVCGLGLTAYEARRRDLSLIPVFDVVLVALVVGVIGARAGYVGLNWTYFHNHLGEAAQWWSGGLTWHAGFIAGLIGAVLYARHKQLPALAVLDICVPGLAVGCALGWLACYTAHCAYGVPVWPNQPLWFLAADLPDLLGTQEPRVAVQLLGAGWSLLVTGCLLAVGYWGLGIRDWPGARFAMFVCLYSLGMFALGFVRGDDMIRLGGLRLDQIVNVILAIAAVTYLILRRKTEINEQPATSNE
jgi:phosphatidylglycerol---prolipoprotein diacylglyceryl transferase